MKEMEDKHDCTTGKSLILSEISGLFNSFFGEVLNILSSRFPHKRGDGSINENEFLGLRAKILRCGNNRLRNDLPAIVEKYSISSEYSVETKKIMKVAQEFKIRK